MVSPDWSQPFELTCNASDFSVRAVLGQREGKHFPPIHFASKTLNNTQQNYTVTEKELLAVQDAKPRLIHWILLLQEFDVEIKNKTGAANVAADHLSRLENLHLEELKDDDIDDNLPDKTLMNVSSTEEDKIPWFTDFANYLVGKFLRKRGCVYGVETRKILDKCHHGPTGGHYGPSTTAKKVFDAGFYWPTIFKEAHTLVQNYDACHTLVAFHEEMRCLKTASKKLRIRKEFKAGDKVLLYNSKYKFKALKLRSKWYGPFVVKHGFPSGYVELYDKSEGTFIINGHRVKLYHDEEQINELSSE
ncbi:reverse transcriptase domain-containing protein [Tanacetum coccineum]|uniref:Reverse transcriptase domain-containing protein n=1 Tax=Tanacetum coccineum TaxID=301880 RepID=A0ABQ5I686_9ASTR